MDFAYVKFDQKQTREQLKRELLDGYLKHLMSKQEVVKSDNSVQVRFKKDEAKKPPEDAESGQQAAKQEVTVERASALKIRKANTINRFRNKKRDQENPGSHSTSFDSHFRQTSDYAKQHS